jgi:glycosyltransferase involved in cell wall biosynthesis
LTRIAIINDVAGVGSLQTRILNGAGYEAEFIDLPKPGGSWPLYAKLLILPARLAAYVPIILRLRRGEYDLVHVHFVSQGFIGVLSGKPFVIHGHGHDLHTNMKNPLLRWISRAAMKRARAIFYVTPDLAPHVDEFASKAYLLPNPLEPAFFNNVEPPRQLRKVLLFTRLYPIKGPEEVFEAAPELAKLVDVSAISWGPLGPALREKYGHTVHFVDRVPRDQVPHLIDSYDAVIGQMKLGILSLSELEAMARGRLVFMRLDRSLYPNDPPPVVDVADGTALVEAVRRLQADPAEMERITAAGRAWVARRHGVDGFLRTLGHGYGATEAEPIAPPAAVPVAAVVAQPIDVETRVG